MEDLVDCAPGSGGIGLGLKHWYDGLKCTGPSDVKIDSLGDILQIAGNLVDMLLYLAGIVAVIFIIYSGISYIISRGFPDKTNAAKQGLIYALVGLAVSILARILVQFIASQFNANVEVQ